MRRPTYALFCVLFFTAATLALFTPGSEREAHADSETLPKITGGFAGLDTDSATLLSGSPIVWLGPGFFLRGASPANVRFGIDLCLREHRFLLSGVCLEEEFVRETPERRIFTSGFGIDRTEVTHRAYRQCVAAGACAPSRTSPADSRLSLPDHPVSGVTYSDASSYCAFRKGRLPTEAEWERAARGLSRRRFPWGDAYNDRMANHGKAGFVPDGVDGHRYAAPVGAYPTGASWAGLLDMAGNVWEWTADYFDPESYTTRPYVDPRGADTGSDRVLRGGSWRFPPHGLRVTHRHAMPSALSAPDVGFRCAYNVSAAAPAP